MNSKVFENNIIIEKEARKFYTWDTAWLNNQSYK